VFPAAVRGGAVTREIPFGAVAQPEGIEFPAQNWLDYGDGARGLALLNRGLPGNNVADGVMMLSLLRSTRIVAYGFGGGYEPGMSSDTGLELGQEFTLDYALAPHAGDWRQAAVYQDGQAFNQPLLAVAAAPHPGPLPARWGFLSISHANVAVSALKPGRDGAAVLRIYEAAGQPAEDVVIRLPAKVKAAEEVNLLEDPGVPLTAKGDTLRISLSPYEIKTLSLRM
jgi:alpha-mannosidase